MGAGFSPSSSGRPLRSEESMCLDVSLIGVSQNTVFAAPSVPCEMTPSGLALAFCAGALVLVNRRSCVLRSPGVTSSLLGTSTAPVVLSTACVSGAAVFRRSPSSRAKAAPSTPTGVVSLFLISPVARVIAAGAACGIGVTQTSLQSTDSADGTLPSGLRCASMTESGHPRKDASSVWPGTG